MNRSGDSDLESPSEYEIMRKKNIAEKERMFALLGLDKAIGDTKELFGNCVEPSDNTPRNRRERTRYKTKKQSEVLPSRRSRRIENKARKIKRVRGFKGFNNTRSSLDSCNDNCSNKEEIKGNTYTTENKSTVRFPWQKQLCSKIKSSKDHIVCRRNEDNTCEGEQPSNIPSFELTEDNLLKRIMEYSSMLKANDRDTPSDSSDVGSNWDKYDKVEFYVSTSEDDSVGDSSFNSSEDLCERKTRREVHRRSSHLGVPTLSPDDVTEKMLKNIAKRGTNKTWDSAKGTTCHQCRQKTLDTKTVCRSERCVGVRGMFCGLCLPNRYGESVAEALKNSKWECPVCRGICNCSFCRARAGKNPTGILYPTVKSHGYENVAAFLEERDKEIDSCVNSKKKCVKVICVKGDP